MGGGKKSGKKSESHGDKPHEIHIKRAHGGGFVVTHHKKKSPMDGSEPETHVVPDADQLQQHVQDNLGDQPPAGTPVPDPNAQAAASQAGAPPSPAGM
jgi:hypothetical protein